MGWMFLWLGLAFATQIWLCLRVGRSSVPLAIATFFVGFPAAAYTLFKHRGDEASSVTVPFLANLVFSVLFFVSGWQFMWAAMQAQDAADEPVVATAPAGERAQRLGAAASAAAAAPASEPAPAAAPPDAVDMFSAALRAAGVNHTVTRLTASTPWPAGVTDAALITASPMAPGAASVPAGGELSVTLYKCESAAACRDVAVAYLQQSGPEKRRVLQNGLLLLLMPRASPGADEADITPATVVSVFRRL